MRWKGLLLATALVSGWAAQPGRAEGNRASGGEDPMLACRRIDGATERLQCYDRAMDARFGVDRQIAERREQKKRDAFGVTGAADDERDVEELSSKIAAVDHYRQLGYAVITLANGQRWRTTTSGSLLPALRPGQAATIRKSGMFGYRLRTEERSGFQGVIRLR